ncbi:MAG: signal peptidase I [Candidatus Doudnabacteria bacterium]|nr:signal peptidase I [Candidatus Doudnabacteria bacterium]
MPRALKITYYIVLGCLALVALLLIFSTFYIPGNIKFYVVQSGSMEPEIKTGSIVLVKPASEYKIGDVITFGPVAKGKVPTTHRIAEVRVQTGEPVYVTKGDANEAADTREISKKDIFGKVLFDVPFVGYAVAWAKTPVGFLILVIIPAVLIIYEESKKLFLALRHWRKKEDETVPDKT